MSEVNIDGAVEALSAELPDDYSVTEAVVSDDVVVEDNQVEPESFTAFDPTVLPEDMQKVYKSMQADYTRKTQEVAELRRSYESFSEAGVDPNDALQAVGFLQQLNNDPEFAKQVAAEIQQNVGTPNVAQSSVVDTPNVNNDNSYENLPPQLAAELEEMRAFRNEMLAQQEQQELLSQLDSMEQTIRSTNPDYTDDDVEAIYSLAYATQGDLFAAQQQYHAIQQRLLGDYLQSKTVPQGATPAPSIPSSIPAKSFSNLDDAHKAAMERIRNIS
jgi:hypothetical protein